MSTYNTLIKKKNSTGWDTILPLTSEANIMVDSETRLPAKLQEMKADFQQGITSEETSRKNADTTLQQNITAEETVRKNADTVLQENITSEETARKNADTVLQEQITANKVKNYIIYNVADYGAKGDGITDDSDAINSCINAVRQKLNNSELAPLNQGLTIQLNGNHLITKPINLTNLKANYSIIFDGQGSSIYAKTTNMQAIDMMGSRRMHIRDFTIWADEADNVKFGITLGRAVDNQSSDEHFFSNITCIGYYTSACLYNFASEMCTFLHCTFFNDYESVGVTAYTVIMDSYNSFNYNSQYIDTSSLTKNKSNSFIGNQFINCIIYRRAFKNLKTPVTALYMDTQNEYMRFQGCYMVAGGTTAIEIKRRDLAVGGYDRMSGLYLGVHMEDDPFSDGVHYFINFTSDSGTANIIVEDFYLYDDNPECKSAVFGADNVSKVLLNNCDINIMQVTTANPHLATAESKMSYIGKIAIPISMGIQSFIGESVSIDLILRDAGATQVNSILYSAGENADIRIYDYEYHKLRHKPSYAKSDELVIDRTLYIDTATNAVMYKLPAVSE